MSALGDRAEISWPIGLRLALVGTGMAALIGIIQVVGTVLKRQWYPYPEVGLWVTMLLVCLAHAAAFSGLLMLRRWSRLLSATLAAGWAAMLGKQITEQLTRGIGTDARGVLVAGGLMLLLLLFAAYLAWSGEVKSFLLNSSRGSTSRAGIP